MVCDKHIRINKNPCLQREFKVLGSSQSDRVNSDKEQFLEMT